VETWQLALRHMLRLAGNVRLDEIDYGMFERFKAQRLEEAVARRTVNVNLGSLSSMLGLAKRLGYLTDLPRIDKLREDHPLPRFLSLDEQARLLRACRNAPKIERFVRIALLNGMRPGEICAVQWRDVDFAAGMIHVRQTKGKRDRLVPLHDDLRVYLAGQQRAEDGRVLGLV
jgi:integrase